MYSLIISFIVANCVLKVFNKDNDDDDDDHLAEIIRPIELRVKFASSVNRCFITLLLLLSSEALTVAMGCLGTRPLWRWTKGSRRRPAAAVASFYRRSLSVASRSFIVRRSTTIWRSFQGVCHGTSAQAPSTRESSIARAPA